MTHTPGPWKITDCLQHGPYGPPLMIKGPERTDLVASISGACLHDPRHRANAALIADAPAILKALARSNQYIEQLASTVNVLSPGKVRAADFTEHAAAIIQKHKE